VHLNQDSWWKDSVLLPYIEALAEKVPSQVPQKVMQILNGFSETVQEA
jgi:hypothetical protein